MVGKIDQEYRGKVNASGASIPLFAIASWENAAMRQTVMVNCNKFVSEGVNTCKW